MNDNECRASTTCQIVAGKFDYSLFFMRVKEARHKIPHCASCTSRIITFGIKHNLQNQDGVPSCWLACLA